MMGGLMQGLGGLGAALAKTANPAQPQQEPRTGPVGLGGPQTAPLAPQFAGMLDPVVTPKSKTLADLLASLS
jgi:hypothetical protein